MNAAIKVGDTATGRVGTVVVTGKVKRVGELPYAIGAVTVGIEAPERPGYTYTLALEDCTLVASSGAELDLFNESAEPRFQAAMAFCDGCLHTTQALNALALVLASYGDDEGSELLKVFARRMATHEAAIL